jgi:hypothetical protein
MNPPQCFGMLNISVIKRRENSNNQSNQADYFVFPINAAVAAVPAGWVAA